MNTSNRPIRAAAATSVPVAYARRRLSSIGIVIAALAGILSAAAAESAGLEHGWAVAIGVAVFVALSIAMNDRDAWKARRLRGGRDVRPWTSMELSADPEQAVGRATGARI
jgi:hypothetical protein